MSQASDTSMLESIARDTQSPIDEVVALFKRERDALAQNATVKNYISLLAVRRVRRQLQQHPGHH
jgi:hypothetical protein